MAIGNPASLHRELMSDNKQSILLLQSGTTHPCICATLRRSVCANFVPVADMHQRLDANAFHLRTSPWPRMTVQRSPQWPFLPSVESSKTAAPSNRGQKAAHVGTDRQEQHAHHARLEAHRAPAAPGIASRPAARRQKRTLASRCFSRRRKRIVASGEAQHSASQQAIGPAANARRPAGAGVRRSCGPTPGSGRQHPGRGGIGRAQGGRQTE